MTQVLSVDFWENKTDSIINNAVSKYSSFNWWTRTQEQFFSDIQKTIKAWNFKTQDEAIKWVLEYAKSKGVSYNWIDWDSILTQINEKVKEEADKSIFERVWETFEKRTEAWKGIIERWVSWKTSAIEAWLLQWANVLGGIADLAWDVLVEAFTELTPEVVQEWLKSWIEELVNTKPWEFVVWKLQQASKNLEDLKELDPVIGARYQWWLDLINWALTIVWWKAWTEATKRAWALWTQVARKWVQEVWEIWSKVVAKAEDLIKKTWTKAEDELLWKLELETVKGKIWDVEVDIPKQKKWTVEKIAEPFTEKDTKVLAWRAVSPRTVWKSAPQKLKSIANVEKNTREFYENIRTWKLEWDISTLENTAETIVNNINTVWNRIWNAVKKVEWDIKIENEITDSIIDALWARWADVSPATPVLKKFFDALWDWNIPIDEAYELKKLFSNEVTKLYKAWDSWTAQYKSLSDWVQFLNTKIDDIIDTQLWKEFANDKKLFKNLKTLVDDIVASSLVEWRKAPNSLAEQIWMVESIFSPVSSAKAKLIQTVWEANSRWWAWKRLIEIYDQQAINNLK